MRKRERSIRESLTLSYLKTTTMSNDADFFILNICDNFFNATKYWVVATSVYTYIENWQRFDKKQFTHSVLLFYSPFSVFECVDEPSSVRIIYNSPFLL